MRWDLLKNNKMRRLLDSRSALLRKSLSAFCNAEKCPSALFATAPPARVASTLGVGMPLPTRMLYVGKRLFTSDSALCLRNEFLLAVVPDGELRSRGSMALLVGNAVAHGQHKQPFEPEVGFRPGQTV